MSGIQQMLLGGAPAVAANYIEDVFSTYLYTGNGSSQTITNGIDLSGKGGLVWVKSRGIEDHTLSDTARGVQNFLRSNTAGAQSNSASALTAFNTDGFSVGNGAYINANAVNYASWTFRKQAKFFDVVTYTGNGTAGRTVAHNLGSTPGTFVIKRTDSTGDWRAYHRSLGADKFIYLNVDLASYTSTDIWNNTAPTSTEFTLGNANSQNINGAIYVAYLFAHDAGGFGANGTDNVISCGSYTGNGSATGPTISLGYEPQWILLKRATGDTNSWYIFDNMRGMVVGGNDPYLIPNAANAEDGTLDVLSPTATGFQITNSVSGVNANGSTYIYIAIRRGPMKTPTTGTEVFTPQVYNSSYADPAFRTTYPPDAAIRLYKTGGASAQGPIFASRLTGTEYLQSSSTAARATDPDIVFYQNGFNAGSLTTAYVGEMFRRAPGFFDVVCYTGTGANRTVSHNLGVAPELLIVKSRSNSATQWQAYSAALGITYFLRVNQDVAASNFNNAVQMWNSTSPTASVFSLGTDGDVNGSSRTYVAYLFASVSGVSKVGSYTGTGTTKQVDCGFTNGSRFVLIKRTDSTGDWYVWDSARGIVAGNDPYLLLNSTAVEVTNTDYVDTYNAGFELSSTAPAAINANGGTFIFLAVA